MPPNFWIIRKIFTQSQKELERFWENIEDSEGQRMSIEAKMDAEAGGRARARAELKESHRGTFSEQRLAASRMKDVYWNLYQYSKCWESFFADEMAAIDPIVNAPSTASPLNPPIASAAFVAASNTMRPSNQQAMPSDSRPPPRPVVNVETRIPSSSPPHPLEPPGLERQLQNPPNSRKRRRTSPARNQEQLPVLSGKSSKRANVNQRPRSDPHPQPTKRARISSGNAADSLSIDRVDPTQFIHEIRVAERPHLEFKDMPLAVDTLEQPVLNELRLRLATLSYKRAHPKKARMLQGGRCNFTADRRSKNTTTHEKIACEKCEQDYQYCLQTWAGEGTGRGNERQLILCLRREALEDDYDSSWRVSYIRSDVDESDDSGSLN